MDISKLLLRVTLGGFMFASHGWGKFMKIISGNFQFPDPLGISSEASLILAVFAEFACTGLVVLGLFTRVLSIPLIITMAVAVFIVHGSDSILDRELPIIYMMGFIVIGLMGSGRYSLDYALRRKM